MSKIITKRDLNIRIAFKDKVKTTDSGGGSTETYSNIYSCWAKIRDATSWEYERAKDDGVKIKKIFIIRFTDKVNENLLVEYENDLYDITYIDAIYNNRKKYLVISGKIDGS